MTTEEVHEALRERYGDKMQSGVQMLSKSGEPVIWRAWVNPHRFKVDVFGRGRTRAVFSAPDLPSLLAAVKGT